MQLILTFSGLKGTEFCGHIPDPIGGGRRSGLVHDEPARGYTGTSSVVVARERARFRSRTYLRAAGV